MYKFIKVRDKNNQYDNTTVKVISHSVTLQDLLEDFTEFLRASGFVIPSESSLEFTPESEQFPNE